jgi:predicted nuclease of predicted toxin-antitoxin system
MAFLKVDENLPAEASVLLLDAGHDALTVHDQRMGGSTDDSIADVCKTENRAILTLDLDFADIRAYPPDKYSGLIVLRLRRQDRLHVLEVLKHLIPKLDDEELAGKLWIVTEHSIRIRG